MADATLKGSTVTFSTLGLREVVPDQSGVEHWKELLLNTGSPLQSSFDVQNLTKTAIINSLGGTHLTLQDIKLPEGCTSGGFCFADSSSTVTRNRFITWFVEFTVTRF